MAVKKVSSSAFALFLEEQWKNKAGYIMCSYGQNPKTGYLNLKETLVKKAWEPDGWYYTQYSGEQRKKALYWREHAQRVFDCQGLSEGYYQIITGTCVDTKARYNYAQWCSPKGSGTIPQQYRVPGAAVFWGDSASSIHHVGYLYKPVKDGHPEGDWYIIEARGVMYGVVRTKLSERKPNFWGLMTKYFDYSDKTIQPVEQHLGDRTLKNGSEGNDVKELQTNLIRLGYSCGSWGADGDFGDATEMAVKRFQDDHFLKADGIADAKTVDMLTKAISELEKPSTDDAHTEPAEKKVIIEGGNCYVRKGPGKENADIGVAKENSEYTFLGEMSDNGWYKIDYKGIAGWVSGKYARLE